MPPRDDTAALALAFRQNAAPPDPDGEDATRALAAAFQARTSAGLAPNEASPAGMTPQQLGNLVRLVDHQSHVEAPVASASATPQESTQPVNFTPDSPQVPPAGTSKTAPPKMAPQTAPAASPARPAQPPAAAPQASSARGATARTKSPASTPAPKPQQATPLSALAAGTSTPPTKTAPPPTAASKTAATGVSTARAQPATAAGSAASAAADPDRDALRRDQAKIRELKRQIARWEAESAGHSRRIAAEQAKPQPDNAAIQQLLQRIRGTDEEFRANGRQPVPGSLNFKAEEARRRLRVLYQQVEDASRAITAKRAPQPAPPAKARVNPRADHLTRGEPLEGGFDPNRSGLPPRTPQQRAADIAYAKAHPPQQTPLAKEAYRRANPPRVHPGPTLPPPPRLVPPSAGGYPAVTGQQGFPGASGNLPAPTPTPEPPPEPLTDQVARVWGGGKYLVYDPYKRDVRAPRDLGEHAGDFVVGTFGGQGLPERFARQKRYLGAQLPGANGEPPAIPPAPELSQNPAVRKKQIAQLNQLQDYIFQHLGEVVSSAPDPDNVMGRPLFRADDENQITYRPRKKDMEAVENYVSDRFTPAATRRWIQDRGFKLTPYQEHALVNLHAFRRHEQAEVFQELKATAVGFNISIVLAALDRLGVGRGVAAARGWLGPGAERLLAKIGGAESAEKAVEFFARPGVGKVMQAADSGGTFGAIQPPATRVASGASWEAIQRDPNHWRGLANELGLLGQQAALGYAIGWITGAGGHVVLDAAGRSIARRLLERDLARLRAARPARPGIPTAGHAEATALKARLAELQTMEQMSSARVPTAQGGGSGRKPSGGAVRLEATRAAKEAAKAELDQAKATFWGKPRVTLQSSLGVPDPLMVRDAVPVARALVKLGAATTEHLAEQLKLHLKGHTEEFYQAVVRALADEEGWPAPGTAPGAGPPTVGGGSIGRGGGAMPPPLPVSGGGKKPSGGKARLLADRAAKAELDAALATFQQKHATQPPTGDAPATTAGVGPKSGQAIAAGTSIRGETASTAPLSLDAPDAEGYPLGSLQRQLRELERRRKLGFDPARKKHLPHEEAIAVELERKLGRQLERAQRGPDWFDQGRRTYDLLGPVPPGRMNVPSFMRQVKRHLVKADYPVVDLRGSLPQEAIAVLDEIQKLPSADQARIFIFK